MEELQVIETTSGRQFKPWATKDDVQDPASVTAITSEIASGKQAIAAAINAKGGEASATESFSELAQDIQDTPTSGVLSSGIVQSEPFKFLDYVCRQVAYPFTEIDDDSVTVINKGYAFYNQTQLLKVKMTALRTISGGSVFLSCTALQSVELPVLAVISGINAFYNCSALQNVTLPNLITISDNYTFYDCSALQNVTLPNLITIYGGSLFYGSSSLQNVTFGTLTAMNEPLGNSKENLRNITIGQDTNINLPFQFWKATNVIAEGQPGIDELNANFYNNLLTKLYDHSNDGQTRTLRIGWLSRVTAENIAYANAKGWTLTT